MKDNRLEHEASHMQQGLGASDASSGQMRNVKHVEELSQLSPVFRKMTQKAPHPAPEQWREFSRELARKLESSETPVSLTLRDKISSTDSSLLRWLWILLALLALFLIALAVGLSLDQPQTTSVAMTSVPTTQNITVDGRPVKDETSMFYTFENRTKG